MRLREFGRRGREDSMEEVMEQVEGMSPEQLEQLVENLVQKLADEGHISVEQGSQGRNGAQGQTRFEITDKSLDFLGYKTLKDLLGALGKSSFGRHDTRDLATGIESSGASRQWEFGDVMNLDIAATLFSAVQREGVKVPLNLEYSDLYVHQGEYQSSGATVVI